MNIYKRSVAVAGAVALLSLGTLTASAEDNSGRDIREERREMRGDLREEVREMRGDIRTLRASTTMERKDVRGGVKGEVREMRDNMRAIRASTTVAIEAEREEFRLKIEDRRREIHASTTLALKNFRADKIKLDERRKENVKKHLDNAFDKLMGTIDRLEKFDDRIEEAIMKRKTAGGDTSSADTALATARLALDQSKVKVETIKSAVNESVDDAAGTSSEALRDAVKTAKEAIRDAHAKYVEVIRALPKIEASAEVNATSTTN